jgi:hypothetical protein
MLRALRLPAERRNDKHEAAIRFLKLFVHICVQPVVPQKARVGDVGSYQVLAKQIIVLCVNCSAKVNIQLLLIFDLLDRTADHPATTFDYSDLLINVLVDKLH